MSAPATMYNLKYRAPGKRPGTTRWAYRAVASVEEARTWLIANLDQISPPALVETRGWYPETVCLFTVGTRRS